MLAEEDSSWLMRRDKLKERRKWQAISKEFATQGIPDPEDNIDYDRDLSSFIFFDVLSEF